MDVEQLNRKSFDEILSSDPLIANIRQKLIDAFHPTRMFLFGSRAYGLNRSDSDYDILLVAKNVTGSRWENMDKAKQVLSNLGISTDVFVYSEEEFNQWKNELNSIPEAAFHLGTEIPIG